MTSVHKVVYTCDICAKRYKSKYGLKFHKSEVHSDSLPFRYSCDLCNNGFPYKTELNLKRHKESMHKGKRFSCDHCKLSFSAQSGLWTHKKRKHEGRRFSCKLCIFTAVAKELITQHISVKHEQVLGYAGISCKFCQYEATDNTSLRIHTKTQHIDLHCCKLCSKRLKDKTSLLRHTQLHRQQNKKSKFKCLRCFFSTSTKLVLKQHMKYHSK